VYEESAPENSDSPSNGTGLIIVSQSQAIQTYRFWG